MNPKLAKIKSKLNGFKLESLTNAKNTNNQTIGDE
jgi:hypothetical protein